MITVDVSVLRRALRLLIPLIAFCQAPAWAATFQVNSTLDAIDAAVGDGICETASGNGICTLRAAVQETNALAGADAILVPAGTYVITRPGVIGDANGSFDIRDDLTIQGAGAAVTIIDGGGLDNVFAVGGPLKTVAISGVTVQNGSVSSSRLGGGIHAIRNNNLTLTDVVIRNNRAGEGGGIFNQGSLTLIRSVVYGNATVADTMLHKGGGIYHSSGTLTIRESTIRDNTAAYGAGIVNFASAFVEESTISGNTATNLTLNSGEGGGGIVSSSGSVVGAMVLTNSTISGNRANSHYGGVYVAHGSVVLNNVTLASNTADADGDGFGNGGGLSLGSGAVVTIRNTIVAGNTAAGPAKDCLNLNLGAITSGGYNLIGDQGFPSDCAYVPGVGDQIGTTASPINAGLKPLGDYGGPTFTHALADTSLSADAGDPSGCSDGANPLVADQRGAPRAMAGGSGETRCDIGAYEMSRPAANAGVDQRVSAGANVLLDGTGSTAWAGIQSYAWIQVSGSPVALAGANTATPNFVAPSTGDALTFQLTVTDRYGTTGSDTVTVTVNAAPVAEAGPDQSVTANATVTLNGTASADSDGTVVAYAWTQTAGSAVALAGADTATPSFVAPATAGTMTFQLVVTDNEGATHADSVTVEVTVPASTNEPPVAKAGRDQKKHPRSMVVLNGWRSYDPDGRIVKYRWVQTGGAPVRPYGSSSPWATFVAPKAEGALTFRLTVTDNKGATSTDTVTVTIDDCAARWYHRFFGGHKHRHGCRH